MDGLKRSMLVSGECIWLGSKPAFELMSGKATVSARLTCATSCQRTASALSALLATRHS